MNKLTVVSQNNQLLVDSREVAQTIEMRHSDLLAKIKGYEEILTDGKFRSLDFFIETQYTDTKGEVRPCYLLTKKGCDMVANKLTGQKGVLFTAMYVTAFEQMSSQKPQCIEDVLIQSLQEMKDVKLQLAHTNQRIDDIRDVVALNPSAWREDARHLISKIALTFGGYEYIKEVQAEIFKLVNVRGGVDLATRLTNKRQRMALEGVCKSTRDKLTKVDIIAEDKKLIEIYLAIVKEMSVKSGIGGKAV